MLLIKSSFCPGQYWTYQSYDRKGGVTNDFINQQNNFNHQLVTGSNTELEVNSPVSVQNQSEPTITLQPTDLPQLNS